MTPCNPCCDQTCSRRRRLLTTPTCWLLLACTCCGRCRYGIYPVPIRWLWTAIRSTTSALQRNSAMPHHSCRYGTVGCTPGHGARALTTGSVVFAVAQRVPEVRMASCCKLELPLSDVCGCPVSSSSCSSAPTSRGLPWSQTRCTIQQAAFQASSLSSWLYSVR